MTETETTDKSYLITYAPTEEDVFELCDSFEQEGRRIKVRAVFTYLGGGSMTTANRLVSLWEDRRRSHIEADDFKLAAEDIENIQIFGHQMLYILADRARQQSTEKVAFLTKLAEDERRRTAEIAEAYDDLVSDAQERLERVQADAAETIDRLRSQLDFFRTGRR